jgi:antitoxin HigA-1
MVSKPMRRDPNRPPVHPGAILREDVLPALRRTVSSVASDLGVSRQMVHRLLAERAPITPEMALRIGKFCGNGADFWLRMQQAYDLWHAERALGRALERIPVAEEAA